MNNGGRQLFCVFCVLLATACNQLPSRIQPNELSLDQSSSAAGLHPNEYVFCTVQDGAWGCSKLSPKSRIDSKAGASSAASSSSEDSDEDAGEPILSIYFPSGSSVIPDSSKAALLEALPGLRDRAISIRGFTDDVGQLARNERLAMARAESIKSYLIQAGLPSQAITVEGHGKCCYMQVNNSVESRRLNRRVEVFVSE